MQNCKHVNKPYKRLVAVVALIVFGILIYPALIDGNGCLFHVRMPKNERSLKINITARGIRLIYDCIVDSGIADEKLRKVCDFCDGTIFCYDEKDAFGRCFNALIYTDENISAVTTNIFVLAMTKDGHLTEFNDAEHYIMGKALHLGNRVIFVWSSGPDGINDKTRGDDVVLR